MLFVCTVVQIIIQLWNFVDALKTSIINCLAFRGLCGTNCKEDDASHLDSLHCLLKGPDNSPTDLSTSHIMETPDNVNGTSCVAQHVQQEVGVTVCAGKDLLCSICQQ
jgi:hypothetical protein